MIIKITNLLNWLDTSTLSGTLDFTFTTSAGLALSSGSLDYTSITALTAYPIDCTVT